MYKQLTSEQRYTISVLLQNGMKQKDIAKAINVSPSTVSREIRRNSGIRGHYNWETAQANAVRTKRKKPGNRSVDKDVMEEAKRLLRYTDKSLSAISSYLGFSSQSHFTRAFKKFAGITPGEYRQKHEGR